jgi:hypothetical protein
MKRVCLGRFLILTLTLILIFTSTPLHVSASAVPRSTNRGTRTQWPTPYYVTYAAIFHEYESKLRNITNTLIDEFILESEKIVQDNTPRWFPIEFNQRILRVPTKNDITESLMNLRHEKYGVLTDICVEGSMVLNESLRYITRIHEYDKWQGMLHEAHSEEWKKLYDAFRKIIISYGYEMFPDPQPPH